MFVISRQQMGQLQSAGLLRFEDEMVAHARQFSPRLSQVLGDEALRRAVRQAIRLALDHGFDNRGPIRLVVELSFLFGSGFATDPQYPVLGQLLRGDHDHDHDHDHDQDQNPDQHQDQMLRAEAMYAWVVDYQTQVNGPDGANVRAALGRLVAMAQAPKVFTEQAVLEQLQWELAFIFPEKRDRVGTDGVARLIDAGRAQARRSGLQGARADVMMVALMFSFGHGCAADPLYPWIAATLADPRIVDGIARAERLERKALTWLRHVLDPARQEEAA